MMMKIFSLLDQGFIKVTGPDAKKFLQGQLTCHVEEITSIQSRLGARCTQQGRVLAIFRAIEFEQGIYLRLPKSMTSSLINSLKKYAIFSKVMIQDMSDTWQAFGLITDKTTYRDQALPADVDQMVIIENNAVIKVPGVNRYEIYGEKFSIADEMINPIEDWAIQEIQQRLPEIYPETSELFTPHDLNLPKINAVSFTKGCYTGQEIVARMHYRATLKQHLYYVQAKSNQPINRGDFILSENHKVGQVVNSVMQSTDHYELLALIKDDKIDQLVTEYQWQIQQ